MTLNRVFLDSAYAIALAVVDDEHHDAALALARRLRSGRARLYTTWAVLLEIGSGLSKLRYRQAAAAIFDSVAHDPSVEVVPLTSSLMAQGQTLFRDRPDKEWSLADCISFVIMSENGLVDALTTDEHFEQAGFRALLRSH
jgi:hypothetical protein